MVYMCQQGQVVGTTAECEQCLENAADIYEFATGLSAPNPGFSCQ